VALAASAALASAGCVNPQTSSLFDLKSAAPPSPSTKPQATSDVELPPDQNAALCMTMAESMERENKETDALVFYERARNLDPSLNDRAARRLAVLYDRHDQQAKAMIEFQQLLKKYPKDASLLNDIGYSFYNRGQWSEAETYLRRAASADKMNKRAWMNLGMTLAQQGKYEESFAVFTKAVSPAEAHANLGFILAQQPNRQSEAIQAYRQALAIEPALLVAQKALQRLEGQPRAAGTAATPVSPEQLPGS
jgi:Tfp pilus assembly protein PilF